MGKFEDAETTTNPSHKWILFRYAEILLNFAEAQNEYGQQPTVDVYGAIFELRERAGIEPGNDGMYGLKPNMTQDEMRQIIRNERRIELAFEEHRFFDIRRWRIAQEIFDKPLMGYQIIRVRDEYDYYEVEVSNARFDERRYLHPIPYSEVIKNRNMFQNPGWEKN